MKNILCFGDSNTWGYTPITAERYDINTRWTGVLQQLLGQDYRIIEEGLNGRTIANNVKGRPPRSGKDILPVLLESHRPLDLVIVSLGTNDLMRGFGLSARDIADNIKALCQLVQSNEFLSQHQPQILLISPPHLAALPEDDKKLFKGGFNKSKLLANHYQDVANTLKINFLDGQTVIQTTDIDGIHWTAKQHNDFATSISLVVTKLLK